MMRPTDGTPFPFTRTSMYGPGGATLRLVGRVTEIPPLTCEKLSDTRRWPSSNACVTEPNRINVTLVMLAPSGVCAVRVWPYPGVPITPVTPGRAPLKRYGGE